MQIFHIASASDWTAAQRSGTYTTSTRGRTLEQEGFIHGRGDVAGPQSSATGIGRNSEQA